MTVVFDCEVCGTVYEVRTVQQFSEVLEEMNGNIICKHCLNELSNGNNPWNSAVICCG